MGKCDVCGDYGSTGTVLLGNKATGDTKSFEMCPECAMKGAAAVASMGGKVVLGDGSSSSSSSYGSSSSSYRSSYSSSRTSSGDRPILLYVMVLLMAVLSPLLASFCWGEQASGLSFMSGGLVGGALGWDGTGARWIALLIFGLVFLFYGGARLIHVIADAIWTTPLVNNKERAFGFVLALVMAGLLLTVLFGWMAWPIAAGGGLLMGIGLTPKLNKSGW